MADAFIVIAVRDKSCDPPLSVGQNLVAFGSVLEGAREHRLPFMFDGPTLALFCGLFSYLLADFADRSRGERQSTIHAIT